MKALPVDGGDPADLIAHHGFLERGREQGGAPSDGGDGADHLSQVTLS